MPPAARSNRPGFCRSAPVKRAALVAEQLALDQALGQGPAIDPDERAGGAVGVAVQGGGHQLLAGPALADDQDGGVGRGGEADRLEDLTHRRALADELGLGGRGFLGGVVRILPRCGPGAP